MKKLIAVICAFSIAFCSLLSCAAAESGVEENIEFDFTSGNTHDFKLRTSGDGSAFQPGNDGAHFTDTSTGRRGSFPFMTKNFETPFDGAKCFAIEIKMRHDGANFNGDGLEGKGSMPMASLYFSGTRKSDGTSFDINGTNSYIFTLSSTRSENNLYTTDGKYSTYFLETSKIPGWKDSNVRGIRFDPIKDGVGEGDIAYIKFLFRTSIDAVGADGGKPGEIPADADSLDLYFSTPIVSSSILPENIEISDGAGNAVTLGGFTFNSEERRLAVKLGEVLKADSSYKIKILDLDVTGSIHFDSVSAEFTTLPRSVSVTPKISQNEISFNAKNSEGTDKRILAYLAAWNGDLLCETDYCIIDVPAGGENNLGSISRAGISPDATVDIYIYDITKEHPEFISNDILVIDSGV